MTGWGSDWILCLHVMEKIYLTKNFMFDSHMYQIPVARRKKSVLNLYLKYKKKTHVLNLDLINKLILIQTKLVIIDNRPNSSIFPTSKDVNYLFVIVLYVDAISYSMECNFSLLRYFSPTHTKKKNSLIRYYFQILGYFVIQTRFYFSHVFFFKILLIRIL